MISLFHDTFPTPLGAFSVAVDSAGAVVATAFGDVRRLRERLRTPATFRFVEDQRLTAAVRAQVGEYFAGERQEFDLPLAPMGSVFQQRVWTALRAIPFGTTRSYAQLAAGLGLSGGARAVGGANAANPICLLVPCHRVIGSDGSLTGFAFGEERKRALLEHERAIVRAPSQARTVARAAGPC